MSERERIADQLERSFYGDSWLGMNLEQLLSDVTSEEARSRPVVGGHSIWELVLHITVWLRVVCERVGGASDAASSIELGSADDWPRPEGDWVDARDQLFARCQRLRDQVLAGEDSDLDRVRSGSSYSPYVLLHGAIQHSMYHAGQIAQIKKMVRSR